jgi:hypothetical protein
MIDVENGEASARRVRNPPACKCGDRLELVNLPAGLDYTPFCCCSVPLTVILAKRLSEKPSDQFLGLIVMSH